MKMSAPSLPHTQELNGIDLKSVDFSKLIEDGKPVILKGVYKDQTLVELGQKSPRDVMRYLQEYHSGIPLVAFIASSESKGRFFYNSEVSGMNFQAHKMPLLDFFDRLIHQSATGKAEAIYAGSTDLQTFFPEFIETNELMLPGEVFQKHKPLTSIWIGNQTTAATHYDMSNNAAACMVGHRRFTLFPPDQIENLYPGPIFPTPAGQVVSMVDLSAPNFDLYPRFEQALNHAQVAELAPGDMLVYPAMWWHQVEALDDFNILINFWWNESKPHMDTPMNMILYGMLALRDRPLAEKTAWKNLFDYYIFGSAEQARAHLPEHAHGPLAEMDSQVARRLRLQLLTKLNR